MQLVLECQYCKKKKKKIIETVSNIQHQYLLLLTTLHSFIHDCPIPDLLLFESWTSVFSQEILLALNLIPKPSLYISIVVWICNDMVLMTLLIFRVPKYYY